MPQSLVLRNRKKSEAFLTSSVFQLWTVMPVPFPAFTSPAGGLALNMHDPVVELFDPIETQQMYIQFLCAYVCLYRVCGACGMVIALSHLPS